MAVKSNVSKLFTAGKRAARMRRSTMRLSRSMSSSSARMRRALAALFGGAVGKDTVSRVWRKVKGDWDAWNAHSLKDEPIIRLFLDGTVVRVRLDRKSTLLVARVI
jgi:transposase-like protein